MWKMVENGYLLDFFAESSKIEETQNSHTMGKSCGEY